MTRLASVLILLLIVLLCVLVGVGVAFGAGRFPALAGPIVLFGILVPGLSIGLVAGRLLVGMRKAEFTARLRDSEQKHAAGRWAMLMGSLLTAGVLGILFSACDILFGWWAMLRAVPRDSSKSDEHARENV